jgi:malonyl-CoA decarboxylase
MMKPTDERIKNKDKKVLRQTGRILKEFFEKGEEGGLEALVKNYSNLEEEEKLEFFSILLQYNLKYEDFRKMVAPFFGKEDFPPNSSAKMRIVRDKLASPREKFFKSFVNIRGGLKFLLDFRGDLLKLGRREDKLNWQEIDQDIVSLLDMWFLEGFLYLCEVGLDTPYRQIEYIKEHDMVHPMSRIEDMIRRLGKDRLCYALYHLLLPHEPVVFIELALTDGIESSIKEIMEPRGIPKKPNTAIFYSINSTQEGLSGLGLGRLLIAKVIEEIRIKHPYIKNFCTLSPIPSLWKTYLHPLLNGEGKNFKMKPEMIKGLFSKKSKNAIFSVYKTQGGKETEFLKVLFEILSDARWIENKAYMNQMEKPLKRIVYFYLTEEKDDKGKPLDPVANFHLENGATFSIDNVRFMGNTYEYGVQDYLSFMVNYIYHLRSLEHVKIAFPFLWTRIKSVFHLKERAILSMQGD